MKEKLEQIEKELEAVVFVLGSLRRELRELAEKLEVQEDDLK